MKDFFDSIANWFVNNWQPIVWTLAIIIIGLFIVKLVLAVVKRQLSKTKVERTIQGFILSISKFVLYLILLFAVFGSLGISLTGLTVVISAISLAVSLALQDSLKNLVNGFVVISSNLLKQNDWVKIGDAEGSVVEVRMLYTILKSSDNKKIMIPNSSVMSNQIINYNVFKTRLLALDFPIAYDSNIDKAKEIIKKVIDSCELVLEDPMPAVVLSQLNDSSLTLTCRTWSLAGDYWTTKWYLLDNVFNEFKREGIVIPFNQLEVTLLKPETNKTYVRKEPLKITAEHKKFLKEDQDFINIFAKKSKNVFSKLKLKRTSKKSKNEEIKNEEIKK